MLEEPNNQHQEQDAQEFPEMSPIYIGLAFFWEVFKVIVIALAIIIPIRYFIVQPFFVHGASMEETFHDADYILIDEISYRFNDPERGDIVVFRYPNDRTQYFIKRVVGLPGETIEVKDNSVKIYNSESPEGFFLEESEYLDDSQITSGNLRIKLDSREYFVMGDNRSHSSDSRIWGPVHRSLITGRVFARAWPFNKAGLFEEPSYGTVQSN